MATFHEPLTPRQRSILNGIISSIADRGYPPSLRELADAEGVVFSVIHYHLGELERKGRIQRPAGIARGIRVVHLEAVEPCAE